MMELYDKEVILPDEKESLIKRLRKDMKEAAESLDFETAMALRDKIKELKSLS